MYNEICWKQANGKLIKFSEMSDAHLLNVYNILKDGNITEELNMASQELETRGLL